MELRPIIPEDAKCEHGNYFSAGRDIRHTNEAKIYAHERCLFDRTVYYREIGACGCKYHYQGNDLQLLNLRRDALLAYDIIQDMLLNSHNGRVTGHGQGMCS